MSRYVWLLVSWLAAAQSPLDIPPPVAPRTADTRAAQDREPAPANGLAVYRAQYCGVCHTLDAAESKGLFGPTHNGIASTAAERVTDPGYAGNASTAEEYIRESILDPTAYLVPGYGLSRYRMGAYTMLSETELDSLVQFLMEQR